VKPVQDKHADSRYGYDYNEDQYESSRTSSNKNRFRSRFVRGHHEEDDDTESSTVKDSDKETGKKKITSTEDAAKGDVKKGFVWEKSHFRCLFVYSHVRVGNSPESLVV
jgi:hypothetical protein